MTHHAETVLFDYLSRYLILSEQEKQALLDLDIVHHFKKGTVLLREGQRSDAGYFVIKGWIRTYYVVDGEEKTTAFYTEAQTLAPQCVVDQQPSAYYVACGEDSLLLVSTPDMERPIFEKFPRFETLCRVMSEELLAHHQASFDVFKLSSPEQRYQHLLQTRPDLCQRVPQYQMASYLGITPQSLSRIRGRLVKQHR
ncbi:cAMP-binding domain of CRP or a regulatory subunit of cAMP-dependent protein kinases [Catalinimonas alkaloidigena]|uniref:cAMP-binding domain of CRP or a regulatory subunit of cAMP-dependent protein kinases n=1 Tax=Catalinimonas alkaloidigena TaxID=1075417 RepID=A0A1G9M360_9BACT|nr:Crp/Fnr family transcriptional regulator [Catalinimonas alkaloidigena]SDL68720.1 cAMP-binding domain of CRP or a regulatory subunit of cAMP-dependent protein kinases [Catalinimonas alkaloidigena]